MPDACTIAVLHYERMTALDAVGPSEVLATVPGWTVVPVAADPGTKQCDGGLRLDAPTSLDDLPTPQIIVVPGSSDPAEPIADPRVHAWLNAAKAQGTLITSVCTGSLVLGAAGLLTGRRATSHWLALGALERFGAVPVAERVVDEGDLVTAAGVASGIDMALRLVARLAGDDAAKTAQLAIEYDPAPPFDCGSPSKAPKAIVDAATAGLLASSGGGI